MKKKLVLGGAILLSSLVFGEEIVIYGPSSMKWVGKKYGKIFNEKTNDTIKFVSIDGIVGRLKLEARNPKADIVIGMTELTTEMAKRENLILPYVPKNIGNLKDESVKMQSDYVVPIDYGFLAFNYNKNEIPNPPKNLAEFKNFKKDLLVESPRLSITGLEALQWSVALYGDNYMEFWKALKPSIYSVESGWSDAFAKFTAHEGKMMLGYATSNLFFEEGSPYDSFLIEDGTFMYQEGASLVNKKNIKKGAKEFMEQILEPSFQNLVVNKNYMFPVTNIELSDGFKNVPVPKKSVKLNKAQIDKLVNNVDEYKKEIIEYLKK